MQHFGRNFNDLPAMPLLFDTRGIGGSGVVSGRADGGSATSSILVEQEGDSDSEGNPDAFFVQANPSVRQTAATSKRSLEADAATGGSILKRPHRSCMLKSAKDCLFWIHVICVLSKYKSCSLKSCRTRYYWRRFIRRRGGYLIFPSVNKYSSE
jgi:hypothetical protein